HVRDDICPELGALDLSTTLHEAREIVGHALGCSRSVESLEDQIRNLPPTEVTEHHLATQHHGPWIDAILVRVLRGRSMRGFEDGMAGDVIDIATRGNADPSHLCGQG